MERILIVRPDRLGDVVLSLPVLTLLRRQFPLAKITFAVQSWIADGLEPILKDIEVISIPANKKEWLNTKLIFDLTENNRAITLSFTHEGLTPDIECFKDCDFMSNLIC